MPGGISAPEGGSVPGRGCLLLGRYLLWGEGVCLGGLLPGGGIPACTQADPPMNRMTDRCKDITLTTISLRPVIMYLIFNKTFFIKVEIIGHTE